MRSRSCLGGLDNFDFLRPPEVTLVKTAPCNRDGRSRSWSALKASSPLPLRRITRKKRITWPPNPIRPPTAKIQVLGLVGHLDSAGGFLH